MSNPGWTNPPDEYDPELHGDEYVEPSRIATAAVMAAAFTIVAFAGYGAVSIVAGLVK